MNFRCRDAWQTFQCEAIGLSVEDALERHYAYWKKTLELRPNWKSTAEDWKSDAALFALFAVAFEHLSISGLDAAKRVFERDLLPSDQWGGIDYKGDYG